MLALFIYPSLEYQEGVQGQYLHSNEELTANSLQSALARMGIGTLAKVYLFMTSSSA